MKKAFYMMAAAAIALSSCSSEETTDVAKSSAITFRPTVGLNSRGAELTQNNLTQMWVSAFYKTTGSSFEDVLFGNGGSGQYFYDKSGDDHLWETGRTYKFIAISPVKTDWSATSTFNKDEVTFSGVTPSTNIKEQKDLIIGAADGAEEHHSTDGVEMNLQHALSQIKIEAFNNNSNLIYTIRGIRIAKVAKSGDYKFTTANKGSHAWTNHGTVVTYDYIFQNAVTLPKSQTPTDLTAECGGAMLIPQSLKPWNGNIVTDDVPFDGGVYISLLLNVKNTKDVYTYPAGATDSNECGWAAVAIPVDAGSTTATWAPGNKYIYRLNLSAGCGKVDPVDPGDKVNPGGTDPSKPGKDPDKGDNIFGEVIKFKVNVKPWDDKVVEADGSTGAVKP